MESKFYISKDKTAIENFTAIVNSMNDISVNGKILKYEFKIIADDIIFFRINSKNFTVKLEQIQNNIFRMYVNDELIELNCKTDTDKLKETLGIGSNSDDKQSEIRSPMPGAVVKISVCEGDRVLKGQTVMILEAMKMENELKAQSDCTVKKIHVKEKAAVEKGQLLIEL
ncbi:acetyl-CoA carboxylase biotin carboxyl carrier protein subunit [Ignavibacteria bacterium CHB1]|nr:MAG: acetyl-CoA carboxylase biotin carboxyl carrier protein subunit [Chlorobiota bacterium]MBV6399200.1 hypothetical protein [Ignavibacteria bacterium]MCC6885353.1 acetyl-CoA carboxylase biotin carboxyl carrier protein subunit [Ignavibacteriales bacterium]MCE7953596.1 acetyl-CoA carboxylase biotin carboxyl carrier protein subunit [Chlorobi bacterium CHB7]MDL1887514.1 acetyl-CoA carboxylase biotin carboxyl carrier protein subunit [Ignavibacteria bacterium CHB1]RIK49219.1 MAG: hypothetical pr